MKKNTQAALSIGAGYLVLKIGIAIHRHPVGSAVVLTSLIIGYAIDGASPLEVASTALSLTFFYGLVFIIGLACAGRWIAALCWFMALFFCVELVQGWIECATNTCYYSEPHWYASKIAANGLYQSSLGDYEWWTNHGRWLPSPAAVCICLLLFAMSVIGDRFFQHRQPVTNDKRKEWEHLIRIDDVPVAKTKRPPPTFENVRLVAEVLSRISAQLIEKHFHLDADIARKFMDRLVEQELFGNLQPDGWHYPLTRQMRLRRSRAKHKMGDKRKAENGPQARTREPASADELGRRIGELDQEVFALKVRIKRLQNAGKTVIAQREEWRARALGAEQNVVDLTAQSASRPATRDGRFDALRRLIAKELHPDFCDSGGLEKTLRAEFFKKLWPEIERLVEGR